MTRVRVAAFSMSLDGYGAGPSQSLEQPLGVGGIELHAWLLATRTLRHARRASTRSLERPMPAMQSARSHHFRLSRNCHTEVETMTQTNSCRGVGVCFKA